MADLRFYVSTERAAAWKRVKECLSSRGILVDIMARWARDQLALCERHVAILKQLIPRMAEERDAGATADEMFSDATDAMKDLGRYKDRNPFEMMRGRTPEPTVGDAFGDGRDAPVMRETYGAEDDDCVKNQKARLEARKAFLETVSTMRRALLELR